MTKALIQILVRVQTESKISRFFIYFRLLSKARPNKIALTPPLTHVIGEISCVKELIDGTLSCLGHEINHLQIEEILKLLNSLPRYKITN